jgi:3-hydroxybutyryl-CoA dehydratase
VIKADIEKIHVGEKTSIRKLMIEADVISFSQTSEDFNPVHLDKDYAENSRYKGQIVHGLMAASLFSGLFGTKLPGIGCVYKSQNLKFKRAIHIGDEVEACIEVVSVNKEKKVVGFRTTCLVNRKVMIDGDAEIFIP